MSLTTDSSPEQERVAGVAARAEVRPEVFAREVVVAATGKGTPYEVLPRRTPEPERQCSQIAEAPLVKMAYGSPFAGLS